MAELLRNAAVYLRPAAPRPGDPLEGQPITPLRRFLGLVFLLVVLGTLSALADGSAWQGVRFVIFFAAFYGLIAVYRRRAARRHS